jgi:hypothetical protein
VIGSEEAAEVRFTEVVEEPPAQSSEDASGQNLPAWITPLLISAGVFVVAAVVFLAGLILYARSRNRPVNPSPSSGGKPPEDTASARRDRPPDLDR